MKVESEVLTFSERADVAIEMLAAGRQLADGRGWRVASVVIADEGPTRAREEIARGADTVILPSSDLPARPDSGALVEALAQVVAAVKPSVILIGSTRIGAEVSARLGQRLGVASASQCVTVDLDETRNLIVERFVYGGRFVVKQVLRSAPSIAAVQIKRFEQLPRDEQRHGEVSEMPVRLGPSRANVVEVKEHERGQVDIGKAEVIVTAGRGVRAKEDLAILGELAHLLGGEVAGSRPLVEVNWVPRDRQVGLSGRTVKPRLYVACGVSGRIEHITGMRSARTVVAINTDPDAPIHEEADYSIVGDLYEVVPALVRAFKEAQGRSAGA